MFQVGLKLDKIILNNFKSYYGYQIIGPFHDQMNAVIGPNGSGKSNLIESLLFVFGKRARSLRANQLHHLIHNSQAHQQVSEGSVEVQFKETREDGSMVPLSLKRTIFHTSLSRYEVNGKECNLDHVTTMLKDRSLDIKSNRFMVLQGEVEQVFLMKSKSGDRSLPGLLEMLEEVIGTSCYKDEMDALQEGMTKTEDKRVEYGERVRVARSIVEQIYLVVRGSVIGLSQQISSSTFNNIVYQVRILTLQLNIENYQTIQKEKEDQLKNSQDQLQEYQLLENQLKEEIALYGAKRKRKMGRQQEVDQKLRWLSEQNQTYLGQLEDRQKDIKQMQDKEQQYEKELQSYKQELLNKRDTLPNRENELNEMFERRQYLEEDLKVRSDAIHEKTTELIRHKKELENNLYPHERKRLDIENELEVLKSQRQSLMKDDKQLVDELRLTSDKTQQLMTQQKEIQIVVDKFQQIFTSIEQNKQQYSLKVQKYIYSIQLHQTQQECQSLNQQIEDIINTIASQKQTNQDNSSRWQVLREIERASQKGLIPQICGRLGDLATIHQKYDIAITVSCPSLDHILVQSAEDAVKCIEYLKSHKLGRCTFIPLDRLPSEASHYIDRPFVAPSSSKRLFDLLTFKHDSYRTVFYNVLRDTLVCDSVEDAAYIAFKTGTRRRVVSLDGKLIEGSGVMSGGGKPRTGGMASHFNNQISHDELLLLTHQKDLKTQLYDQMHSQQQQISNVLNELQRDDQQSKSRYKQNLVDLELLKDQISELQDKEIMLRDQIKKSHERKEQSSILQEQIQQLVVKLERIRSRTQEDQSTIKQIDREIQKIGGDDYERLKDQLRETNSQYDHREQDIQKIKAQLSSLQQKLEKTSELQIAVESESLVLQDKMDSLQRRLKDIQEQSLQQLEKDKTIKSKIALITVDVNRKENELKQYKLTFKDLQDQCDTLEQEITKYKELLNVVIEQQLDQQGELTLLEESYADTVTQYKHKTGNYLQVDAQEDDDDLSFQSLFMKHLNQHKLKYAQSIRQYFISGFLQLLPEKIQSKLKTYSHELQPFIQHLHILQEIAKEHQPPTQSSDPNIIIEYILRSQEYRDKLVSLNTAQKDYHAHKSKLDEVRVKRKYNFEQGFHSIAQKLREIYQHLSGGGDADLDLIDSLDPFSEGVTFQVRPKNKTWKPLSKLSGGEKTLSSLSLILSMHFHKPNSFYFFDEIDAALDYKNVGIVAKYLKSHTKTTQFCVISLRNNMFEEADKLVQPIIFNIKVGIYKLDDCTQVMLLNPEQFIKELQEE